MLDGPKYVLLTFLAENHLSISTVLKLTPLYYIIFIARSSSGIVSLSVVFMCTYASSLSRVCESSNPQNLGIDFEIDAELPNAL